MGMGVLGGLLMFVSGVGISNMNVMPCSLNLLFVLAAMLSPHAGEVSNALSIIGCSMMCVWVVWAAAIVMGITGIIKKEESWPNVVGIVMSGGALAITILLVIIGNLVK